MQEHSVHKIIQQYVIEFDDERKGGHWKRGQGTKQDLSLANATKSSSFTVPM